MRHRVFHGFKQRANGLFEIYIDDLRHANNLRLRFYTEPTVTLHDMQWQDAIRINRKCSRELEYDNPPAKCRRTNRRPALQSVA